MRKLPEARMQMCMRVGPDIIYKYLYTSRREEGLISFSRARASKWKFRKVFRISVSDYTFRIFSFIAAARRSRSLNVFDPQRDNFPYLFVWRNTEETILTSRATPTDFSLATFFLSVSRYITACLIRGRLEPSRLIRIRLLTSTCRGDKLQRYGVRPSVIITAEIGDSDTR